MMHLLSLVGFLSLSFVVGIVSSTGFSSSFDPAYHYENQETWPEVCKEGTLQTPINLDKKTARRNNNMSTTYSDDYFKEANGSIRNIGLTIATRIEGPQDKYYVTIETGETFQFGRGFFHWPSGHTINRKRYALEVQLVHFKKEYGNWENASLVPGGIFVISILYEISEDDNELFQPLIEAFPHIYNKTLSPYYTKSILGADIPKTKNKSFYRYLGSTPIPMCRETIIWQVYTQPAKISKKQLKIITNVYSETGRKIGRTNRDLQNANGRPVNYKRDVQ